MEDLTSLYDSGESIDIIYFDFRKAFDTVPHERLLIKCESYGVTGKILKWVRDFLSNRSQRVKVNHEKSSYNDVLSGIPQGSILGPILFTLFINDIPEGLFNPCKIFADDTKLYGKSVNFVSLQDDIDKLNNWSLRWNLFFNSDKCKVLHMGKRNPNHEYLIKDNISHKKITVCKTEKDIGVTFDENLNFDSHIHNIVNKANQMLGIVKRTFCNLDAKIFNSLYKSMVRPHLEYANSIWHPYLIKHSILIEKVQRRATKLVRECKGMSYKERLVYLNLHSLKGRRLRGDLIITYKIFNGLIDINPHNLFPTPPTDNTRNSFHKIFITHHNTNIRKNTIGYRVARYWNSLDAHIKSAKNTNAFKNYIDDSQISDHFLDFDS